MDEKERERQKSFPALSVLSSIFSTILNEVFHSDKRSGLVWMGTFALFCAAFYSISSFPVYS